jgi:NAD(P)-dependent dehydrogenase (short-subunit alcohol dehydrogenase family)
MPPPGTILVTGANGGLGSAIVSQIVMTPSLAADYHDLYTVHNTQTATTATGILAKATLRPPQQHELVALDLCRLAAVRAVAADIHARRRGPARCRRCAPSRPQRRLAGVRDGLAHRGWLRHWRSRRIIWATFC